MLADAGIMAFAIFYLALVVGSMVFLSYAWYRDYKRKRRPNLRLVKREDD